MDGHNYTEQEQKVVDFDKIEEYQDAFKGIDTGFCALGTTRGKSGVVSVSPTIFIIVFHDHHHYFSSFFSCLYFTARVHQGGP